MCTQHTALPVVITSLFRHLCFGLHSATQDENKLIPQAGNNEINLFPSEERTLREELNLAAKLSQLLVAKRKTKQKI